MPYRLVSCLFRIDFREDTYLPLWRPDSPKKDFSIDYGGNTDINKNNDVSKVLNADCIFKFLRYIKNVIFKEVGGWR